MKGFLSSRPLADEVVADESVMIMKKCTSAGSAEAGAFRALRGARKTCRKALGKAYRRSRTRGN